VEVVHWVTVVDLVGHGAKHEGEAAWEARGGREGGREGGRDVNVHDVVRGVGGRKGGREGGRGRTYLPVLNSRRENSMELTDAAIASAGKPSFTQSCRISRTSFST